MTEKTQDRSGNNETELSAEDLEQIDGAAARSTSSPVRKRPAARGARDQRIFELDLMDP